MDYNITYREKDKGLQIIVSYKDNTGRWRQKSKQGFEKSREGKKKAKAEANKIIEELTQNSKIIVDMTELTIEQLRIEFLEHISIHRTYGTLKCYRDCLLAFNSINDIKIKELKVFHIQKCVNDLVNVSATSTIKLKITVFNNMLRFATTQYNFPLLDLSNISIPKENNKNGFSKKALSLNEQTELLKLYKTMRTDYYLIILFGLKAGLRIGEIMGLTWNDVDFEKCTLEVNKQWKINKETGTYGFGNLKSKNSYRTIPLSKSTILELKEIKRTAPINTFCRVLTNNNTANITASINYHLKRNSNVTPHELRHTYATNLISNGIDFKTAAKLLGHEVEQTMKVYSHVTDDMLQVASNVIEQLS